MATKDSSTKKCNYCYYFERFTYAVVTNTENFFYRLGLYIGHNPLRTIWICWAVVFLSAFGFFRFDQEKNPLKLWVPPQTTFVKDSEWLMKNLQMGYREQSLLVTADDVLTPAVLTKLAEINQEVKTRKTKNKLSLKNVCFQLPKVNPKLLRNIEANNTNLDPSVEMNTAMYCSIIESMKKECYTKSILELWNFNWTKISALTKEDIINVVNNYDKDSLFGKLKNFEDLLGGIERNKSGHIVSAKALQNFWYLNLNFSSIDMDVSGNYAGTADWASEEALEWELLFLDIMKETPKYFNNSYYTAGRSFGDISNATMFQDIDKLSIGIILMIIYVILVISKFNWLEIRVVLALQGLLAIGMAFVVGAGLCSLVGIFYGPVHTSLPFLLMGLGVDDMFVIMACWEELSPTQKMLPTHEKVGLMMKHAGVSITITSFTDVIAFIIGSSTILPCLESFCIYAAVCVLMTFVFAVTFFVACLVLDQRRFEKKINGVVPCVEHENFIPNNCSQKNLTNRVFETIYKKVILTMPGKIIVIIVTIVFAGFSLESTLKLEQRFDPKWFIPQGTYLADYLQAINIYYPQKGFDAGFYMGKLNYTYELNNIKRSVDGLNSLSNTTANVITWVEPFREFILYNYKHDIYNESLDDARFSIFLSKFLHSPWNAKYQANFIFDGPLECGEPTPNIKMSIIDFHFRKFKNPRDQIPAMHEVRSIATNANFSTGEKFSTVWSKYFATWITDELIDIEVMRNLQLALLCVMLCTILLIANLQTCWWIFVCVLITMVNVCGFMQRWGLTLDLVSCIGLELAIGLCVDYATHVGHTFLTIQEGSRQERAVRTVSSIGSAVLYGGLSTFIGVSMMSLSNAYTFQSFFRIFFLVIIFGLFHGIVFLPVVLSWIGPKPYRVQKPVSRANTEIKLNDTTSDIFSEKI